MSQPTINCPKCNAEVKLTESLAAPLIESIRRDYEDKLSAQDKKMSLREQSLKDKEQELKDQQISFDEKLRAEVEKIKNLVAQEESAKAKRLFEIELNSKTEENKSLQELLQDREEKLNQSHKVEVEFIKKQRALEDEKRALDLTIEKKVQEKSQEIRLQSNKDAEDYWSLKIKEQEIQKNQLKQKIEELKKQMEQGSQQLQGEAQELELEEMLKTNFPIDRIEAVPKGNSGGDILHRIINDTGQMVGTILWESKRTKSWNDKWLSKLKEDQREAKAECSILISQALPINVETFSLVEGVYVTHPRTAFPLALALRQGVLELFTARKTAAGQQTKAELVYQYLTGPDFRYRVDAIVDAFTSMKNDLEQEKKFLQRQWAKRDKQIDNVISSTQGMYGDLQAIAGKTLIEIKSLEIENPELEKIDNP